MGGGASDAPPTSSRVRARLWLHGLVLPALAVIGVFLVHFRPWQEGLLEDWGLARAWDIEGMAGLFARIPATLGRPLHLVPHYVGMAMSDGGFVGPYAVLGMVAVLQLVAALWALAPMTRILPLRWAVALAIALHPWWAPGEILRFMPAQVAVLGVVLWLGASVRFLATGRATWLWLLVLAPAAGLLTYQGPAAVLVLGSAVLALTTGASWARRVVLVGLTTSTVIAVMVWSAVIAPRLSPDLYESQFLATSVDPVASVRAILRTIVLHAPGLVLGMLLVAVVVTALGFAQYLSSGRAWLLLLGIAGAPLTALAYALQGLHLNDPERVALPVGLTVWVVLACALPALSRDKALRTGAAATLLVGSAVGALVGYGTWTAYTTSQQALMDAVQTIREDLPEDVQLVVADTSGRFGDVYLFLPPHLNVALDVEYGPGADALICTPEGIVRNQPTAALYPLVTTPDCGAVLATGEVTRLGEITTQDGVFDFYELEVPE